LVVRSTTNDGTGKRRTAAAIEATTFDSTLPSISKCNGNSSSPDEIKKT
jgi:uncharacterized membrane protein YbjE (DUF340 family)